MHFRFLPQRAKLLFAMLALLSQLSSPVSFSPAYPSLSIAPSVGLGNIFH